MSKAMQHDDQIDNGKYDIEARKIFLEISKEDADRAKELKPLAEDNWDEIITELYDHFSSHPTTLSFLQSDRHVDNLKKAQGKFFKGLLGGVYDDKYMAARLSVGRTHERIGLEPEWYIGAYAKYISIIMRHVFNHYDNDGERILPVFSSFLKLVFMDIGFAIDAYIEAGDKQKEMRERFTGSLSELSGKLSAASTEIVATATEQSATVAQQASSVQEVTSTVAEVKQTSHQSLEHANNVIDSSEGAVRASEEGISAVERSIAGMHDIQKQVEAIADKILGLSEQTQQIGEIIQSVNEISEQSKLLALNAAIEAARAGEHGKGFSVVASEIRSLADQSKQATNQVRAILGEIQKATNSAVIATEEGNKKVDIGVDLANTAGANIHKLAEAIRAAADSGRTIASSSHQQTAGVEQIADAINQISDASQDSLLAVQRTEGVARDLSELSDQIGKLIESFSVIEEKVVEWKLA